MPASLKLVSANKQKIFRIFFGSFVILWLHRTVAGQSATAFVPNDRPVQEMQGRAGPKALIGRAVN